MAIRMNKAFAVFTRFIGAIKNRQVLLFQMRNAFHRHRSADETVCLFYLLFSKAKPLKQAFFSPLLWRGVGGEAFDAFLPKYKYIKKVGNIKRGARRLIEFSNLFFCKPF